MTDVSILYPLKTPENRRFYSVFKRYKIETLARNGLMTESSVFIVDFVDIFANTAADSSCQQIFKCYYYFLHFSHFFTHFFSLLETMLVTGLVESKWSSLFSNVYFISFIYEQCTNLITLSVNNKELGQYLSLLQNYLADK